MRVRRLLCFLICLITLPIIAQDELTIPDAVPLADEGEYDIINILLMGSATYDNANYAGLTDTLMIVSLNADTGDVAVVSIPRDFYAYVPDFGMYKINQSYFIAERATQGTGVDVLQDTITYNFGLEIDYWAWVNFDGFADLVNAVGGVDVAVDCAIEDWMLKEPDLNRNDADNWEMVTLWAGMHHMDGDLALWYVRSRRTSSDLDRARRQQDLLRAIWRKIRADGMLENFPTLWEQFNSVVDTNITLADATRLFPLVADLDTGSIRYYNMRLKHELNRGYTPDEGRFIFTPIPEGLGAMMQEAVTPPTRSRLASQLPTVAIYNGSGIIGLDWVAAQRLEREGFRTVVTRQWTNPRNYNFLIDHIGESKNSAAPIIQKVMRVTDESVRIDPDAAREYDYELHLGNTYQFTACTFPVAQPTHEDETE